MKKLLIINFFLFLSACGQEKNPTMEAMMAEEIKCPEGAQAEINRWGENGWSQSCKMKHGVFTGWENGRKVYEARYDHGKQVGEANWLDKDGSEVGRDQ